MKAFNGMKPKKSTSARELLPAGGYVAKIMKAEEVIYDWGKVVIISFDISEGEFKEFFAKDYRGQTQEDKKWRGVYRLIEPKDDGSEKDEWTKNSFNNSIWSIEESNPGYHFDWDETKFKGKFVGVLFREKEWAYEGNTGWTTECCALTDIGSIRNKTFKVPKKKPLKDSERPAAASAVFEPAAEEDSGDLPF